MTSKEVTTDVTGDFYLSLQGRVQTNKKLIFGVAKEKK